MLRHTLDAAAPELIQALNIWWKAFGGIPNSLLGTAAGVLDERMYNRV